MGKNSTSSRVCPKCGEEKLIKYFVKYKSGRNKGWYHPHCNICRNKAVASWKEKRPWYKSFTAAMGRCCPSGGYHGRVKFKMTVDDFKRLWFRDKAYLMERPSIDRIENDGDYVFENCRFIELKLNQSIGGFLGNERKQYANKK